MPPSTEQLIAELAAGAEPVRRLRPPLLRALFWLIGVAAVAALVIPFFADFALFARKAQDAKFVIELVATLLTGIAAVIAAFELSVPDRSPAWAWLPVPPLALWLASSGYNCWRDWNEFGDQGWHFGESAGCFGTIIGFSIPLGVALILLLAREAARPDARRRGDGWAWRSRPRRLLPPVQSPRRRQLPRSRLPRGSSRPGDRHHLALGSLAEPNQLGDPRVAFGSIKRGTKAGLRRYRSATRLSINEEKRMNIKRNTLAALVAALLASGSLAPMNQRLCRRFRAVRCRQRRLRPLFRRLLHQGHKWHKWPNTSARNEWRTHNTAHYYSHAHSHDKAAGWHENDHWWGH